MKHNSDTFSIIMPPPNVTGSLHMGHALTYTIQDALIRYAVLQGKKVRWQSGFDHAGIATQMLAEKELAKSGKSKNDMTRQEFLNFIESRKDASIANIKSQIDSLGMDIDWSNSRFTLDKEANEAVIKSFVELYNSGLIYREKKLINWDSSLETTVSDLEVISKEVKGKLYYIKYFIEDSEASDFIEIATTRPETIFGDAAVAVNPHDDRYTNIKGKKVIVPISNRAVNVIFDDYVKIDFGTGALKVTPAHDFNDFEIGKRHNLEFIEILNKKGEICNVNEDFDGLKSDKAREKVVDLLREKNLITKEENISHAVPYCDRSGAIVEPRLTTQWFFDVKDLANQAMQAVQSGKIEFYPKHWESTYMNWLKDIQPWCISRQLVWGHQIPAWYDKEGNVFVANSEEEVQSISKKDISELERDEDVLDTWFSSALWPFSSLGWPQTNDLLKDFYPSSVLVTGFDIIFFWVARMVMMGLSFIKEVPFEKVYILPIICDAHGNKMSKTKGNSIDPIDISQKYSTDALRIALVEDISSKRSIKFVENNVELARNFVTKMRNAHKFIEIHLESNDINFFHVPKYDLSIKLDSTHWILHKLLVALKNYENNMRNLSLGDALEVAMTFFKNQFCDWYIEITKSLLCSDSIEKNEILNAFLILWKGITIMFYPFIPEFFKNTIMPNEYDVYTDLMNKVFSMVAEESVAKYDIIIYLISEIRSVKGILDMNAQNVDICIVASDDTLDKIIQQNANEISKLAKVTIKNENFILLNVLKTSFGDISLAYSKAIFTHEIVKNIQRKINKLQSEINILFNRLNNVSFVEKAEKSLVREYQKNLEHYEINCKKMLQILDIIQKENAQ